MASQTTLPPPNPGPVPHTGTLQRRRSPQQGFEPLSKPSLSPDHVTVASIASSFNQIELEAESHIWESDTVGWTTARVSLNDILSKEYHERSGLEIYFLPRVEDLDSEVARKISAAFHVPEFFWTHTGWNANGFYGSLMHPLGDGYESHASYQRFLIKEIFGAEEPEDVHDDPRKKYRQPHANRVIKPNTVFGYEWQYIAFITFWFREKGEPQGSTTTPAKQVVLCFDQSTVMQGLLIDALAKSRPSLSFACPYSIHRTFLSTISVYYDLALWDFQAPVRSIEKSRISNESREIKYKRLHEVSRHIIHMNECLAVGLRTVTSMRNAHSTRCGAHKESNNHNHDGKECYLQLQGDFEFFELFLRNLQSRAAAFEQRLSNETTLSSNLLRSDDSDTSKKNLLTQIEILEQSKHDGRELTNLVALLTLIFLPLSFFTGFFGMHFFDPERSNNDFSKPRRLWLFFAVSVPVAGIAVIAWIIFRLKMKRKDKPIAPVEDNSNPNEKVGGQEDIPAAGKNSPPLSDSVSRQSQSQTGSPSSPHLLDDGSKTSAPNQTAGGSLDSFGGGGRSKLTSESPPNP